MMPNQEKNAKYTKWFMLGALIIILVVDVILGLLRNAPTISRILAEKAYANPLFGMVIVFAMGVLAGHFFWVQRVEKLTQKDV